MDASEAAASLGMPYPTYVSHENGSRGYGRKRAEQYGRKFRVPAHWLLFGDDAGPETFREAPASKIVALPVTGYVEAGKWFDIDGDGSVPDGMAVHIVGDRPVHWHRAFIVSGNSINKIAGPGDVLVCLDLMESGTGMQPDDLVIVERSRFGGQMIERTAKRLRKTATGWELWPESTDPAFQTPIVLNGADDHEEIKVKAKVLWAVRSV